MVSSVGQPLTLCLANTGPPNYTCTQSRDVSHVTTATSRSGALIVGPGDSGGPVYQRFGANLKANGTITAEGNGPRCTNWAAQTTRTCSNTVYFTDVGPELSLWGLTVQ